MFQHTKILSLVALGSLSLGAYGASEHSHTGLMPQASPAPQMTLAQARQYTCSMHPQVRSSDPNDRCPICGMALVPVDDNGHDHGEAGAEGDAPVLRLSSRALALVDVGLTPVTREPLTETRRLSGHLAYDESRLRTLSAWMPGRLERLHISTTGATIERGQAVADIYSPELLTAQTELLRALRITEGEQPRGSQAEQTARAARNRLRLLGLDGDQIDEIIARGRDGDTSEYLTIRAPQSGVVLERLATEGAYVNTGDPLYQVADLRQLWAVLEAYERDLAGLAPGQTVTLSTQANPGESFEGQISFIEPSVRADSRTTAVRVEVDNREGRLKPGMLVRARVEIPRDETLVIPASAPLLTGERALVYVRDPEHEGRFSPRVVRLGARSGDHYPVLDGLEKGELVVHRGAFRLDSELQIRGLPSMMAPEGGGAPDHDHTDHDHSAAEHRTPTPVEDDQDWSPLFRNYLAAQDALAHDDFADWQRATESLQKAAEALHWPEALDEARDQLLRGAGHIHHVADLDAAQDLFYPHSEAMITLTGSGLAPETLHLFYCPMARDDAGAYWLQADDELRNPYFGAMMFRCGEHRGPVNEGATGEGAHDHD